MIIIELHINRYREISPLSKTVDNLNNKALKFYMKKKIIRPPKQKRSGRSSHSIKNSINNTAVRSAPNLSAVLKSVSISNSPLFDKTILQPKPEIPQQPIRWITTGDGEEIPMRAVYYYSNRSTRTHARLTKTEPFDDCAPSVLIKLFYQKCRICYYFCDFTSNDVIEEENKKIKLECLNQLLSLLRQPKLAWHLNNDCLTSLMHMITINIFRPVCSVPLYETTDYAVDLEWEHIEVVYDLFIALLNINTFRIPQTQIKSYIRNLFLMFRMPDKREGKSIGLCLNEICRRYSDQRPIISAKCTSFLAASQYDLSTQKSLPVFLEFYLHSMLYLRPKDPNSFIQMYLFPLIMLKEFENFHATHLCIIEVFMNSDSELVDGYLLYLLNHWPIRSINRTTLFLNAVHDIVSKFHQKISNSATEKLLGRISNLFSDCTADISQQALFMIIDDGMTNLILSKGIGMIHTIYIRILDVFENHWLSSTRNFAADALSHLKKCIPPIRSLNINETREKIKMNDQMQMENWEEIRKMVGKKTVDNDNTKNNSNNDFHVKPPANNNSITSSPRRCNAHKIQKKLKPIPS